MRTHLSKDELDRVIVDHYPFTERDFSSHNKRARAIFDRVMAAESDSLEVSESVTAIQSHRNRKPHLAITAAILLLVAAAGFVSNSLENRTPSRANKGGVALPTVRLVDFTRSDGKIIVKITDPYAARGQLTAAFRHYGLDISVGTVAASPSIVGTFVFEEWPAGNHITSLRGGTCLGQGQAGSTVGLNECQIGLVISGSFHGKGYVTIGRAARPGERYESSGNSFSPGEVFHCTELLGKPVSSAVQFARNKHLTIDGWWVTHSATYPTGGNQGRRVPTTPKTGIIVGVGASSSRSVGFVVGTVNPTSTQYAKDVQFEHQGC